MWFKKFIRLSWELKRNIKRNWKSLKKFIRIWMEESVNIKTNTFFYPFTKSNKQFYIDNNMDK